MRGYATRWWGGIRERLAASPMLGGILKLAGGTGLAQAIAVGISPVLSRLYTRADFGVYTLMLSTSGLLTFLATLRYELAVPLPAAASEARRLVFIAAGIGGVSVAALTVLCQIWGPWFFTCVHLSGATAFWWVIPVAVATQAAYQVGYFWALRTKAYRVLAVTRIWQSLSSAATYLLLGWLVDGPLGLLVGLLLAQGAGVLQLYRHFRATSGEPAEAARGGLAQTAREHARFSVFGSLAGFLNASGILLPALLVGGLYGTAAAGDLGLAVRMVSLPMQLIGTAVAQVFLAEAAQLIREDPSRLQGLFFRLTRRLSKFGVAIAAGGAISPWVFPWVFGENWHVAGHVAAWVSLSAAAQIVVSPLSNIAILMKRQDVQLLLDGLRAVAVVVSLWLPWRLGADFLTATAIFSLAMLVLYGLYFAVYVTLARQLAATRREPV
ncbi:MAG: lipopolysaccharide biosynthesis protein [Verrucomicrobiales bacterium]|nr:lipopolysaccharide biosynthesis protein [Verrucomicrobiales bacterium]